MKDNAFSIGLGHRLKRVLEIASFRKCRRLTFKAKVSLIVSFQGNGVPVDTAMLTQRRLNSSPRSVPLAWFIKQRVLYGTPDAGASSQALAVLRLDDNVPFVLDRNVPLIGPPKGGQIGADGDEQEGVGKSRSAGASAQQAAAGGGCGAADARELPAGEAAVEAVWGGRRRGSEAPQRGTAIESCLRGEVSAEGAAAGAREVRWAGR